MAHEECFDRRTTRVKGWKGAKHHGGGSKCRSVEIDTKELVNGRKSSWRPLHLVVCWSQPVHVLIPWWRAWEEDLNQHSSQIHVSKSSCEHGRGSWRSKEEHEARADKRSTKMGDAIWKPCQNVESHRLVRRKDITEIRTIDNVLERREDSDPNWWSVFARDESDILLAGHCASLRWVVQDVFPD